MKIDINFIIQLIELQSLKVLQNSYIARRKISGNNLYHLDDNNFLFGKQLVQDSKRRVIEKIPEIDFLFSDFSINVEGGYPLNQRSKSSDFLEPTSGRIEKEFIYRFLVSTFSRDLESSQMGYPSAGGLYGVQVFCAIKDESSWELIHILKNKHEIEIIGRLPLENISRYIPSSENVVIENSDFIVFYIVVPPLATIKYNSRGIKFSLIEVGTMMQHASINANLLELGTRVYGYYDEQGASNIFNLNPKYFWVEGVQLFRSRDGK